MSSWYTENGTQSDVVVSTRIRLARNLKNYPFPSRMTEAQRNDVNKTVRDALLDSDTPYARLLRYIDMDDVPEHEVYAMVERHIISPEFAGQRNGRAVLLSEDETVCVMLGEEDHIRIQVILGGFQLEKAYEIADQIDNILSSKLQFAYDEQLGFLTECPTNLGTGLRASVMLHLPVLQSNGQITDISDAIGKIGFTVRGMYGEGSQSEAAFYQVSNQITLGITEKNALDNLGLIVSQIAERERTALNAIPKAKMEDIVWRAYGLLKYQRSISSAEMMNLVSRIKMGVSMGIIDMDATLPVQMLIETQPNMLCRKYGDKTDEERDILRSGIIREMLG